MFKTERFSLVAALLAALLAAPGSAQALIGNVKLIGGWEQGHIRFGDLADFIRYRDTVDGLDVPEQQRYELRNEPASGFRVGIGIGESFELVWSRTTAHSRYQAEVDGVGVVHEPAIEPVSSLLPTVDVRFDLISAGFRLRQWNMFGFTPIVRGGVGWALVSQDGYFQFLGGPFEADYSDSDHALELSAGLEYRWRMLLGAFEFRTLHWRFDTQDVRIPDRVTHAYMTSVRLGVSF